MVNSTGEGTIGRCCIINYNHTGFPFDSHVLVIRLTRDIAHPAYLALFLKSPIGQRAIEELKGAKTTKQTELGTKKLAAITTPLPPIYEQYRIVVELDALQAEVDTLKRLQAETTTELDAMLPSILDRAFRGELLR